MHRTELLTVNEVAERLGIAVSTVHQRIQYGKLMPTVKLPTSTGPYLFDREYIEALAAKEKAKA